MRILLSIPILLFGSFVFQSSAQPQAVVRLETLPDTPGIAHLGWDTEGGERSKHNLLYAPIVPQFKIGGEWKRTDELGTLDAEIAQATTTYRLNAGDSARIIWRIVQSDGTLTFRFETEGEQAATLEGLKLDFPFEPKTAATTVLPSGYSGRNRLDLPAIISAPDLGQMLLSCEPAQGVFGTLLGQRIGAHTIDFVLETPLEPGRPLTLRLEPLYLPMPQGFSDEPLWRQIRRGWFNMLQPSADWGTTDRPQSGPPGVLANNVISDPVSCVLHMPADHVLLQPQLAPGIHAGAMLRNTVDYWLDEGILESGEMRSWRQVRGMLDANAGVLIGAWDYLEATADRAWLERRIGVLERLADYLANRDIDLDGLVEGVYSGNYGTQIGRLGGSAYDTFNSGHKDGYGNLLTYRAWRCMADLEQQLGRAEKAARYRALADRLKEVLVPTLFNPQTGWLAWWKSQDGELHDLSSHIPTSLAVLFGLVDRESGREMLNRLWTKMESVGFERFDLGVPLTFEPVRKGDYMQPKPDAKSRPHGSPEREDGSDTFQSYLNGGCCISDTYYFTTALTMVGEEEKANRILNAMVNRQVEGTFANGGGFQCGVIDEYPKGAEFFDWQGNTCGYEGHLVYSFSFLQGVLMKDAAVRKRILRPLFEP